MLLSAICVCDIKLDMGTLDLLVLKKYDTNSFSHDCTLRFRSSSLYTKDDTTFVQLTSRARLGGTTLFESNSGSQGVVRRYFDCEVARGIRKQYSYEYAY